ncbi:MAG: hypothetical protein LW832_04495 [Parachlamydia sp.]|jgi:hypothetical protein|nr:hypothetical protein [Parachlamydia sp.]
MLRFFLLGGIFALFLDLYASATSTQVVTFSVSAIEAISVSGNPAPLNITAALPGSPPHSATDSLTSYSLTSNLFGETITGSIDVAMPANTSLSIRLAAPIGAASSGPVDLTTTPKNLVTSIGPVAQSNLPISYTLSAGASATPFSSTTRTVTLTLGP